MGGPTRSAPLLILCPADRDGGSGRSAGAPAPPSSPGAFGTTLALRYLAVCSQARVALSGVPAAAGTGGKRACWSGPLGFAALVRRTRARPRRELSGRSAFAAQRDMLAFCRTAGKRFSLAVLIACIMRRSARLLLLAVTAACFLSKQLRVVRRGQRTASGLAPRLSGASFVCPGWDWGTPFYLVSWERNR